MKNVPGIFLDTTKYDLKDACLILGGVENVAGRNITLAGSRTT